ncbi:MAG TPA: ChbG/HpnK family deacetylase, partial [Gemmatimonadaceae bacterium]
LSAAGGVRSQIHRALIGASWRVSSAGAARTRAPDHFIGVSMQGSPRFARHFAAAIDGLSSGTTEIMVHPGRVDDALGQVDGYTWQRETELAALLSPELRERLRRGDPSLIGFGGL